MKKIITALAFILTCSSAHCGDIGSVTTQTAQQESLTFVPPAGWQMVDKSKLTPSVLAMVVGKGSTDFPPSINLAFQTEAGSLKQFLKFVKKINDADGIEWKDLGPIRTQAGEASLSQLEMKTEWGLVKEMQVIYVKDDVAYILTAAALKEEFPKFYKEFFASLRSLKVQKSDLLAH